MKAEKHVLLFFIIAILFLSMCSTKVSSKNLKENKIEYKYEEFNESRKRDIDGRVALKWSVSYPIFTYSNDKKAEEKINREVKEKADKFSNDLQKENEYIFNGSIEDTALANLPYGGFLKIIVKRSDNKMISMEIIESRYSGGAHSSETYRGVTFDSNTGKEISFNDLSYSSVKLYEETSDYINMLMSMPSYKERMFENQRIKTSNEFVKDNKWFLSDKEIIFMTDPYEISPYAEGSIEFLVPYDKITSFKKSYLLLIKTAKYV